jgi:heme ABC exporter ATP-binding subunit CcmA
MGSPEAPLLRARGLVRRFARTTVLAGVDLDLSGGEVLLLQGANGTGKSTLLRLLAGLGRPDAGNVELFGAPVRDRLGQVGFLSHDASLYADLTVLENLRFTAQLHGCVTEDHIEAGLVQASLTAQRDRLVRELSRGQLQRAALLRAVLHGPDLLLLDEPYTGLDRASSAMLTAFLSTSSAEGRGIIMVGHDPTEGWEAVTRVARLDGGRWMADRPRPATPAELLDPAAEVSVA